MVVSPCTRTAAGCNSARRSMPSSMRLKPAFKVGEGVWTCNSRSGVRPKAPRSVQEVGVLAGADQYRCKIGVLAQPAVHRHHLISSGRVPTMTAMVLHRRDMRRTAAWLKMGLGAMRVGCPIVIRRVRIGGLHFQRLRWFVKPILLLVGYSIGAGRCRSRGYQVGNRSHMANRTCFTAAC